MENIANSQGFLHIFEKIFLALDAETLVNCSLVNRSLASSLKNPRFWFKLCKQRNLINRCFEEWNTLLETTEENEPRKEDLSRILKILCIDKKDCLKKLSANYGDRCHPLPLSIFCQQLELADYSMNYLSDIDDKGSYIFDQLKLLHSVKAFHTFAKMYENFKTKVKNLLMQFERKVLLTYENDIELFKECLTIFGDNFLPDEDGNTVLHQAAEFGCINIMKLLASADYDLDVQNNYLYTPLYIAVRHGNVEIVLLLISNNANPNFQDRFGNTMLHLAAEFGYVKIMKILMPLVDNLNIQNKLQRTPLAMAVYNGNVEIVKLLISENADPNIADTFGKTPYDYATQWAGRVLVKIQNYWPP